LAFGLIESAVRHGIKVVVLDAGSSTADIERMKSLKAHVFDQADACEDSDNCMGIARRLALKHALKLARADDILIWMEPEKQPLIEHLSSAMLEMNKRGVDMLMLNRRALVSYPKEQACAYRLVQLAASAVIGEKLDFMFGPLLFRPRIAHFWLDYDGVYGDRWDSLHIPKLRAIMSGVSRATININYVHPPEQTAIENEKIEFVLKRLEQSQVLIGAIMKELKIARI
jgi:hypothetical protein